MGKASRKKVQKKNRICVVSPGGTTTFNSITEYQRRVQQSLKAAAQALVNQCSPANVDFTLFGDPVIRSKELTSGGTKFQVNLFVDAPFLASLSRKYNQEFQALFQIWCRGGSMLLPITREQIAAAGHNWRGDQVIAPDDILNRAVATLRLNQNNPVLHHIAQHLAYEIIITGGTEKPYYEGINALAIHRVWD